MADITWADVEDFAAELSVVDPDAQTLILAHVNSALSISLFGGEDAPKYKLARIYLASHMGAFAKPSVSGTTTGPVVASSAGGLSRSFANTIAAALGSYGSTRYGLMYEMLLRTTTAGMGFAS